MLTNQERGVTSSAGTQSGTRAGASLTAFRVLLPPATKGPQQTGCNWKPFMQFPAASFRGVVGTNGIKPEVLWLQQLQLSLR